MNPPRKLPKGRIGRLARLAKTGLRSGASLLLSGDGHAAAHAAAETLGSLRGLAAKAGQMASYVDGLIPAPHRDAYEAAMRGLLAQAPSSAPAQIRLCVEEQLGAPLHHLFAEWHDTPLASASIGQVHRARLADGRPVAVKVQHPGIVQAVESDLGNAGLIEGLVDTFGGKRLEAGAMLAVVRKRFREELDYALEAQHTERFRRLHAGDPRIHIPAVIAERSGPRVLTTELVEGLDFTAACQIPAPERTAWAETLWRFVFKGCLVGGVFNADPHPGNYVFHPGGRVSFLDFGCVQPLDGAHLDHARAVHRAAAARDLPAFQAAGARLLQSRPGPLQDLALCYLRRCFAPIFDAPYHLTRDWAASLVDDFKDMAQAALSTPKEQFFAMPQQMLFMNRLQFGFYSVLARLDVTVNYAAIEQRVLQEIPAAT